MKPVKVLIHVRLLKIRLLLETIIRFTKEDSLELLLSERW